MSTIAFTIKRGDTFSANITVKDSEGTVIDLTDKTIFFTAKKWVEDPDSRAVIKEAIVDVVSPEDGQVTLNLTAEQTSLIHPGVYWWDIQMVENDSVISTAKQRMKVTADVSIGIIS